MPTELTTTSAAIWNDLDKVKRNFAPSLSNEEFEFFVGLGAGLGANPFLREIWAVKYGSGPASVFLGRDFYRKKAQEQETYDGHTVDSVCENDSFSVSNGVPSHSYTPGNRGKVIGAYCTVYLKNTRAPFFVFCEMAEYSTGKSLWLSKPSTMIKKVAEAQALRGAFQGVFAGTYSEAEQWEETPAPVQIQAAVTVEPDDLQEAIALLAKCSNREEVAMIGETYPELAKNPKFRAAAKAALSNK